MHFHTGQKHAVSARRSQRIDRKASSQLDSFPCTCRGENSSCFHCFGTGVVSKPLLAIGRPHRNLSEAAARNEIAKYEQPTRARAKKKSRSNNVADQAPVYTKCPNCGEVVRRINRHRRLMHGIVVAPEALPSANLTECEECRAMVKNLPKHKKKAHGPAAKSYRNSTGKKSKLNLSPPKFVE